MVGVDGRGLTRQLRPCLCLEENHGRLSLGGELENPPPSPAVTFGHLTRLAETATSNTFFARRDGDERRLHDSSERDGSATLAFDAVQVADGSLGHCSGR